MTMHLKVLAAILIFTTATWAGGGGDELDAAVQRQHEASARVWYHEMQTTIAERDFATARITSELASTQRSNAISEGRNGDAEKWAKRLTQASRDEREAQSRADANRRELMRAQVDLQASSEQVRRLERVARRR